VSGAEFDTEPAAFTPFHRDGDEAFGHESPPERIRLEVSTLGAIPDNRSPNGVSSPQKAFDETNPIWSDVQATRPKSRNEPNSGARRISTRAQDTPSDSQ
jgi:hypothetical protein